MKDIKEFRETLAEAIKNKLGEGYEVLKKETTKINRIEKIGITVVKENSVIAPIIYVEDFYERFQQGRESMEEIVDSFISVLKTSEDVAFTRNDVSVLYNWDSVKTMVKPKLINTEKNTEFLEKHPSVPFCNLAVVFFVQLSESAGANAGIASVSITNNLLDMYGIPVEDLFEQAMLNLEKEGVTVRSISSVLFDLLSEVEPKEGIDIPELDMDEVSEVPMFVMTNSSRIFGAAAIASTNVRKILSERFGKDCYILPSSIHELLIVPCDADVNSKELLVMVDSVNSSEVNEEDLLATNVYLFRASTGLVEIAE